MNRTAPLVVFAASIFTLTATACAAADDTASHVPTISSRYFVGGSAKINVSGSFQIDAEIPINTAASFGDGEMTWVQFGISGSAEPNALMTYSDLEIGITVGKGRNVATAEASLCSGASDVSATTVAGHYECKGIDSYNPATGEMGRVDIEIVFTANSQASAEKAD